MGRMKDTAAGGRVFTPGQRFGRSGGAGGRDLVRVDARSPCPVCHGDTLCRVDIVRLLVWCNRTNEGSLYSLPAEKGLRQTWVHALDGATVARFERAAAPTGAAARAEPEELDAMHRHLLGLLDLAPDDREELRRRGLDDGHIVREGYRTMPERDRARLARELVERFGVDLARRLPGVRWKTDPSDPGRGWYSLGGWPGILIPCRDLEGRVVALKVRRRGEVEKGQRYTYVSSAPEGPKALASVHVPASALALREGGLPLLITEGELKAAVSTALSGRPVVSVPGVSNWPKGLEMARAWGSRVVVVAFDADVRTSPDVARAQRELLLALRAEGFDARLLTWPEPHKGLDDFLLARRLARLATASPTKESHEDAR